MQAKKKKLFIIVLLMLVLGFGLSFYYFSSTAPQFAQTRLIIDLVILLLVATILGLQLIFPAQPVKELTEAIRALSIGYQDRRLDMSRFGELEEVARAYNELAASLSEQKNPNLGPIKVKTRQLSHHEVEPTVTHAAQLSPSLLEAVDNESTVAPQELLPSLTPQQSLIHDLDTHVQEDDNPQTLIQPQAQDDILGDGWTSGIVHDDTELYQIFSRAHSELELGTLPSRDRFLEMLDRQRSALRASSDCEQVLFEIVCRHDQLALQPHLIHGERTS